MYYGLEGEEMNDRDIIKSMKSFRDNLMDKDSEILFEARMRYFLDRDKFAFYDELDKLLSMKKINYSHQEFEKYLEDIQGKEKSIVVFGAGELGKLACKNLKLMNKSIKCICDNSSKLDGKEYRKIPIRSVEYLKKECMDNVIIIAVYQYQKQIYNQLLNLGIEKKNIFMPRAGELYFDIGKQYFDLEEMPIDINGDIFVDAGCYDAKTSKEFWKWNKGRARKIYAFEPDIRNWKICEDNLKAIDCDYELFQKATWDKEEWISFEEVPEGRYASKIVSSGNKKVQADTIDNCLNGREVTYIKLDVEGSELKTLKGAINTIKKYKPKMAISIYHKPEDIIEIPKFLEELEMTYHYYIRHYQTRMQESILYAI